MNPDDDPKLLENGKEDGVGDANALVLSVDIGTTNLRSHIYDHHGHIRGSSGKRVKLMHNVFIINNKNKHVTDTICPLVHILPPDKMVLARPYHFF